MKHTLTNTHLQMFKAACEYWSKLLGICYRTEYFWTEDKSKRASVVFSVEDHWASIYLGTEWDVTPTKENILKTSFHEVCHLALGRLSDTAMKFYSFDYIVEMEHEIISKLIHLIFKD